MNPDVMAAVERLRREKTVTEATADFLARIAGGRSGGAEASGEW